MKNSNLTNFKQSTTFFQVEGNDCSHNHNLHTLKKKVMLVGGNDTFYKGPSSSFLKDKRHMCWISIALFVKKK